MLLGEQMKQAGWPYFVKTLVDRVMAASGLVLFSPVLGAAAAGVALTIGRPVLFVQERPGRNGHPIRMFKLRTMTNARDDNGTLLTDAERITAYGRFLRTTSIDDLPNLINVLRGELSLVGPRPLLTRYLPLYNSHQARRHEVMPGITGWAQVHGRNAISHEERFNLDVWYVDNWSLGLDIRIIAKTVATLLRRDQVTAPGEATKELWRGNLR